MYKSTAVGVFLEGIWRGSIEKEWRGDMLSCVRVGKQDVLKFQNKEV